LIRSSLIHLFLSVLMGALLALPAGAADFRRGDANCDGREDLSDAIFSLRWLFLNGSPPCCLDALDSNDDGSADVADPVFTLLSLLAGGRPFPAPSGACGGDPSEDDLGCGEYLPCGASSGDPEITEWRVPWSGTRPRDPYVGPGGIVWFAGQTGNYVGQLDPSSGEFRRFDLPAGAGPHNVIASDFIWYAGNGDAHIGRLDPATGQVAVHPMPDPAAADPHTLVFDAQGDIWFTVQQGNFVGKLRAASGEIRLLAVPTPGAHFHAPERAVWFGTDAGTIGRARIK
jgi:streptogramin lyase